MNHLEQVRDKAVPGGSYRTIVKDGKKPYVTSVREFAAVELRKTDIVVDIGAFVGAYTLRAAKVPVERVFAYEPTAEAFRVLRLNASGLENVTCVNSAVVTDGRSEVEFYVSRDGIGVSNSVLSSNRKNKVTVSAIQYEEAVKGATVVKIDVEGAEYSYPVWDSESVRALIIDFHPVQGDWKLHADEMVRKIESHGFSPLISPRWGSVWTRGGVWRR